MMNEYNETIAALSSGAGKAGVAVIRVCGKNSIEITSKVFFPCGNKSLSQCEPRYAVYGEIICNSVKTDTGLCTVFKAPNSYTGEDTCEISVHGSEVGTAMLLSALYENGARPAQAGEFTKRAFINGKLSLSQAEAVGELIDAQSSASQILANARIKGSLSKKIDKLCNALNDILSSIYAYIDYPDEDLADMSKQEISQGVADVLSKVNDLVNGYDIGKAISEGVDCAILGSPNVGKSSFLNYLSGDNRAIVTDIAGTTRDIITEMVTVGNVRLKLSDTAGIRQDSQDEVEKIGITRAYDALDSSEVVFALFDITKPLDDSDKIVLSKLSSCENQKNVVYVLNKCDKDNYCTETEKEFKDKKNVVRFSAKTGLGMEDLKAVINSFYPAGNSELQEGLIVSNARQYASLKMASEALNNAVVTLEGYSGDMAGFDLEKALESLRQTDGRSVSEEIVNGIFSRFCVGK